MKKHWINLGAGGNDLPSPWENFDIGYAPPRQMDVREKLPYGDGDVEYIVISHVLEHITAPEVYGFLEESHRVLSIGGILRITVPDITRTDNLLDDDYLTWTNAKGFGDGTRGGATKNLVCNHGHLTCWTFPLFELLLKSVGFQKIEQGETGMSMNPALCGLDIHDRAIGKKNNWIESLVIEATKE